MKGVKKSDTSNAKPKKTLLDFFQRQTQQSVPVPKIECPACGIKIPESKVNWHLDQDCASRSKAKKTKDKNLLKRKNILKSVKKKIAIQDRKKVMLSDDESDFSYGSDSNESSDIEVLDDTGCSESDLPYINSSMVETRLFEMEGKVDSLSPATSQDSSPPKLNEKVASPYFSPNSKNITVTPPKREGKIVDYQIPSSSKRNNIAMLELDWSSPPSPTKAEERVTKAASCSKVISPQTDSASNEVKKMLENDWNICSPSASPEKTALCNVSPQDSCRKPDSETEDFEENSTVYRTPKKIPRRYVTGSPNSTQKLNDVNENSSKNKEANEQKFPVSKSVKKNSSVLQSPICVESNKDSDDDFEDNPVIFKTPEKPFKKSLKKSPCSSKNMKGEKNIEGALSKSSSIPSSPASDSGGSCGDSEQFSTPLHSPGLVSPYRSPSPVLDGANSHSEGSSILDATKTNDDSCVRKLFTPSNSPLKSSQESNFDSSQSSGRVNISPDIKKGANRFSKIDGISIGDLIPEVSSCIASQGGEASSQSSKGAPKIRIRSPRKINQSLKSSALLQNSPQKASSSFIGKQRSQVGSPEKPVPSSPGSSRETEVISPSSKPDKSVFRGVKGVYLDSFLLILDTILSEPHDRKLFDDEDLSVINTFQNLSLQAQKLYVRLFQRKIKWNKVSKIEYRDICDPEDTELYVNELAYANFLLMESELDDLDEVLQLLSAEDLQNLCKTMKISATGKKDDMVKALKKFTKQQVTIISAFSQGTSKNSVVLKRAKETMGRCCLINKEVRRVFLRVIMLFGLPRYDDEEDAGQHTQLTTLLMVNFGKMNFPEYDISRKHHIFLSRDELIRFEGCSQILYDVQECLEGQKWEEALAYCDIAKTTYEELIDDQELMNHDMSLPRFLRRFTSISVLIYTMSCAVECYQRLKNYRKAVKQLEFLLSQTTHLQDYRGRWYDRLALNLDMHLKSPKAVEVIREALNDREVRKGHRLSLSIRAERMAKSSRFKKFESSILDMPFMNPREAPRVIIEGRCLPGDAGYKKVFIRQDSDRHAGEGEVTVCSVEELVLGYYKSLGYTEGLHREGTTVNSLFGLLFWDAVYSPVPDAFRSPHQATPLDLDDTHFYEARKEIIDKRLQELNTWSEEEVKTELERIWNSHYSKTNIVAWDIFRSLDYVKDLVVSMKLPVVASICKRLAEDHRFTRSGFPDLVVWDPVNKRCRIVEVKGPNDRLSTKQILWLDYLLEHGAEAEVCHVEAIGAKKMKLASPRRISPRKWSPIKRSTANNDSNTVESENKKGVKRKKRKEPDAEEKESKRRKKPTKNGERVKEKNKNNLQSDLTDDDFEGKPSFRRSKRTNGCGSSDILGPSQSISKKKKGQIDDAEGPSQSISKKKKGQIDDVEGPSQSVSKEKKCQTDEPKEPPPRKQRQRKN